MHTPTPWTCTGDYILGPDGQSIELEPAWKEGAWENHPKAQANAAFIVQAVNTHDDLIAALKAAQPYVEYQATNGSNNKDAEKTADMICTALAKAGH